MADDKKDEAPMSATKLPSVETRLLNLERIMVRLLEHAGLSYDVEPVRNSHNG